MHLRASIWMFDLSGRVLAAVSDDTFFEEPRLLLYTPRGDLSRIRVYLDTAGYGWYKGTINTPVEQLYSVPTAEVNLKRVRQAHLNNRRAIPLIYKIELDYETTYSAENVNDKIHIRIYSERACQDREKGKPLVHQALLICDNLFRLLFPPAPIDLHVIL